MTTLISFTINNLEEETNKTLCYMKDDKLFLSNHLNILIFFREILSDFDTIIYFEDNIPQYYKCKEEMKDNGSRVAKPNKLECIRKKQYICLKCYKTKVTSLEPFIRENANFSYDICEKSLNHDYMGYLSYDKKN